MAAHILLIDDDEALTRMVSEYLQGFGYSVIAVHSAHEGLARIRREPFDALILDVMLPDGDGFDVCRGVREMSTLPILMLTARGEPADRIVGLELGADDYLPKPFEPRELLARLRAIRRRARMNETKAMVLRFGRLEIDPDARRVSIGDDGKSLTSHQFDLLCLLASNAGRVMSREVLMDRLRGTEFEAFDRSLDVHISRIRAEIEDDPKQPRRILTVRGAGYVFAKVQD